MTRYTASPRVLTPPREQEEVYPYRRAWRSLLLEMIGLLLIAALLSGLVGYVGVPFPESSRRVVNLALGVTPALLWLLFSRLPETWAVEPRFKLTGVFVAAALIANGAGVPMLRYLAPDEWLSGQETVQRAIGYTLTIGVTQEFLKYLVVRYTVWRGDFRNRFDAIAYCAAAAAGYATVTNLYVATNGLPSPDVIAIRVFVNTTIHFAGSLLVAYGMASMRFNPHAVIVMPVSLITASIVTGIAISTRGSLVNAGFALGVGGTRPLLGLIFAAGYIVVLVAAVGFLFNTAERRAREQESETAP